MATNAALKKMNAEFIAFISALIVQSDTFRSRTPTAEKHYQKAKKLVAKAKKL
jgi:hypothetical protein